jgi:hypothetical protein
MTRDEYHALRRRYEPDNIRLLIVAESPPASGLYFYNPEVRITEPLFAAPMGQLGISYATKDDGLLTFQRCGWVLIDATYEPVNQYVPSRRDEIIAQDYPLLLGDLAGLTPDRSEPLVLVKANVRRLLQDRLIRDGFNVLNCGIIVPFPSTGQRSQFRKRFGAILETAGIRT